MADRKAISLLIKGIYIIVVIITISIFLNRILSLNVLSTEETRAMNLRSSGMNDLNKLAGNEECLAFKEKNKIENSPIDLSLHSVIDAKKLEDFSKRFSGTEPDCARDYDFGYRVRVETLVVDINSTEYEGRAGGVFGEVLDLINGKNTTFLLDSSASMKDMAGPKTKIECLKDFMKAFVEKLRPGSGVAIFAYGVGNCGVEDLSNGLVILGDNREELKQNIDKLHADDNTPMGEALEKGFNFSNQNRINRIVLLTDGCQYDCAHDDKNYPVQVAEEHKNDRIIVHTIGFGLLACVDQLKEIARMTGGEFFDARLCEDLINTKPKEPLTVNIPPLVWEFGDSTFSKENALKRKVTTSVPVDIFFNESTILPAKLTITIVDGELETFLNAIEQVCLTKKPYRFSMSFSYSTFLENNSICMNFPTGKTCQKISCETPVSFSGIKNPGNYQINIQPSQDLIKVTV